MPIAVRTPRRGPRWARLAALVALLAVTVVAIFPLYWLFVTAFTPTESTLKIPPDFVPVHASLANFQRLFVQAPVLNWTLNSVFITLAITAFHMLFDTMAGYAFARLRFPGRGAIFAIFLSTIMIPSQVTLIPNFLLISRFHLVNTPLAVILPGFADIVGIFLIKQFMQTLPRELEEAAAVDGATPWWIFWRVMVPLSTPAIAAVAIFGFVSSWNAFLWPLIVLQSGKGFTLPVGIAAVGRGEFTTDYGVQMAGGALAAIPTILFFLMFQRHFVAGLRVGAVKS
jgi:multiple sugar transport system permease protein